MDKHPIISFKQEADGTSILHYRLTYDFNRSKFNFASYQRPKFIVLIGNKQKTLSLHNFIDPGSDDASIGSHGGVQLYSDPYTLEEEHPVMYFDCELHEKRHARSISSQQSNIDMRRQLRLQPKALMGKHSRIHEYSVAQALYSRVLGPFSSVICFFVADFGSMERVCEAMAQQVDSRPITTIPMRALPRVLLIFPSSHTACTGLQVLRQLLFSLKQIKQYDNDEQAKEDIHACYRKISILRLPSTFTYDQQFEKLRANLFQQAQAAQEDRRHSGMLLAHTHVSSLIDNVLERFTQASEDRISLIKAAREKISPKLMYTPHLSELFGVMQPRSTTDPRLAFIASAFVLDCCPPGAHFFLPGEVFDDLYRDELSKALQNHNSSHNNHRQMVIKVREIFELQYSCLAEGAMRHTAAQSHLDELTRLRSSIQKWKSNRTCLCCLARPPEKVLRCKHAICDTCVQIFGKKSRSEKFLYTVEVCMICGEANEGPGFRTMPPSAGPRILSLDGGGVKGIVPLMFLLHIDSKLSELGCPLQDYFDLVCGTSSGGLIALGIFLKQWSPSTCVQKFEQLSHSIFQRRMKGSTWLTKIHELLTSYIADCRYDSAAIETVLRLSFGANSQMFSSSCSDTKVAVTATTAKESMPCLFAKYNGVNRPEGLGYALVRAIIPENDVLIRDAARCTSAAPWYFKPKSLESLGTFQDGGLIHNNPLKVALREARVLWPCNGAPDLAISLGTGKRVNSNACRTGSLSPVTDRFLSRVFRTFMLSLDGEKAWNELACDLSADSRTRLHRLNVPLKDHQSSLDDVSNIPSLKEQVDDYVRASRELETVKESIYASLFYFELETPPRCESSEICCFGNIFCRLNMPKTGRQFLYTFLREHSAYFLINGRPFPCVETIPKCLPPFRRRIKFTLQSETDSISITLRYGELSHLISGQPTTLKDLIHKQMMDKPFGRPDHVRCEKTLPLLPEKRKLDEQGLNVRSLRRRGWVAIGSDQ